MQEEREFKGVWIPKEIWLDERLNMIEKGILTEIDSLDDEEHGCYASNEYLAKFCQCSETKVSTSINKLIKLGYIYLKSFDGRKRILKSRLSNYERQTLKNLKADFKEFKEININNNINYNNIIAYLNDKAGTNYRSTTNKTQSLIRARINEKFTEEDFYTVIDKKVEEWKGTEFEKFLRPETLFGNKFESYLNSKINNKKSDANFKQRTYTKSELSNLYSDLDEINL